MADLIPIPNLHDIPLKERTTTVRLLLHICHKQQEQIKAQQEQIKAQQEQINTQQTIILAQQEQICLLKEQVQKLKDEIAVLKGQKPKPNINPSTLEKTKEDSQKESAAAGKRAGSLKRHKTEHLEIHARVSVLPEILPWGSCYKGYEEYTVQELIIKPHNTVYQLQRWMTPEGKTIWGRLPSEAGDGHFGPSLVSYILYQYYHAGVTQPRIWEALLEFGVDISTGQVNRIITEGKDRFHTEKDNILKVGLTVSRYLHVDDTGARHQGKNGYCTHIGNQYFAWFESTSHKSRINFLALLRGGHQDYVLNADAIAYMESQKLPKAFVDKFAMLQEQFYPDENAWKTHLEKMGLTVNRHVRIATEGALLGSVIHHGIHPEMVILSDDAGQFNVLRHALCWVHAERLLQKLMGLSDEQRLAVENKRTEIWDFYESLKAYKTAPPLADKTKLSKQFDVIFTEKTCFASLNKVLERLYKNKQELLLVLDRPDIPLHNNDSERDIREYVTRRKISGSTRSDLGRRCRDTFLSIKKTCRKLGISFWQYLNDRVSGSHNIPQLSEIIRQRAQEV